MFQKHQKYLLLYFLCGVIVFDIFVFYFNWQNEHHYFTFAMLDVGQGDALFIQSPTGVQILIDGGPPKKILTPLSTLMPLFDKSIDALIITNPDQDHIAGFSDVLDAYEVGKVFEPGTLNDSKTFQNLKEKIKEKNIPLLLARKGMRFDLGGETYLDILFPDRDVSGWDTNEGSVVARLTYHNLSLMLTGDSTTKTEKIIQSENPVSDLDSSILKAGHHGSRTSSSFSFVEDVSPLFALISNGKDNKYGHPHPETLDTFESLGVKVFRTDLLGTIIFRSDGKNSSFSFRK